MFLHRGAKADATARCLDGAWRHQITKRVEHEAELPVVLPFELREPAREIGMGRKHAAQPHERPDDLDIHPHRPLAAQHARQHRDALLGKRAWQVTAAAA